MSTKESTAFLKGAARRHILDKEQDGRQTAVSKENDSDDEEHSSEEEENDSGSGSGEN